MHPHLAPAAVLALMLAPVLAPAAAHAACQGQLVMSCPIGKKQLELCLTYDSLTYSFGPRNRPELVMTDPIQRVDYRPWPGAGRNIWDEVNFSNKGTVYTVWTSFDRMDPNAVLEGGVVVSKGGAEVASLTCAKGTVGTDLYAVYLAKEAAGQCWNRDTQGWQGAPCP